MPILAVVLGRLPSHRFNAVIRDLKYYGFEYNPDEKEWSKAVEDHHLEGCLKLLEASKVQAYIKE